MGNKTHTRLDTARDVKKLLSKVINQRLRGEIDTVSSRDVGYLAKILLDVIKVSALEEEREKQEKFMEDLY